MDQPPETAATPAARHSVGELADLLARLPADAGKAELEALRARFQAGGLEAIAPSTRTSTHPQATPKAVGERILALALEFPDWGCVRIAEQLKREANGAVSSPTVQTLLIKHGLGSKASRIAALEAAWLADPARPLSPAQVNLLERANPPFRERATPASRPGALLVQECFLVGNMARLGNIYLHAVVDAYHLQAFGFLYPGKRPECAVAVLHNDVIPFYERLGLPISEVLTDTGWEYSKAPYQFYLRLNEITHRTTSVRGPAKHGGFELFHDLARAEFCKRAQAAPPYASVEALQADLDAWLTAHNHARPLPGYPNAGATAADRLAAFRAQRGQG